MKVVVRFKPGIQPATMDLGVLGDTPYHVSGEMLTLPRVSTWRLSQDGVLLMVGQLYIAPVSWMAEITVDGVQVYPDVAVIYLLRGEGTRSLQVFRRWPGARIEGGRITLPHLLSHTPYGDGETAFVFFGASGRRMSISADIIDRVLINGRQVYAKQR